jgi:hypothetical protein
MRERRYYVYIMASKSRVLYVGVTGFLMARVLRHKAGEGGAFTREYVGRMRGEQDFALVLLQPENVVLTATRFCHPLNVQVTAATAGRPERL